jgi:hypothetical protein
MSRKKKWIISLSLTAVILVSAGWYAKVYITNRVFDSIESALKDPEIQKTLAELDKQEIDKLVDSVDPNKLLEEVGGTDALPSIAIPEGSPAADKNKPGTDSPGATSGTITGATPTPCAPCSYKAPESSATTKPGATATTAPKPNTSASPKLEFEDRDSAANYAMKKFSSGELIEYMSAYKNKAKLSPEEKRKIKQEILSRFNSAEIHALTDAVQ